MSQGSRAKCEMIKVNLALFNFYCYVLIMINSQKIVETFTTKMGHQAIIRYPQLIDAEDLTYFINTLSLEDKFTRFSGEQLSLEEEKEYIQSELEAMEAGNVVKLFCYVDKKLAGYVIFIEIFLC